MTTPDNVLDFTLARKRRHARLMAQAMWNLYASRANVAMYPNVPVAIPGETQRA